MLCFLLLLVAKTLFTPSDDCHESELATTFNWKDSKKEQLIWQQQSLCDKKLAIETHLRELELQVVTQRLLKAFPEKYSPRTPGGKLALQKDIATFRIACNNKIPSVADDERNMFLELLEKQRQLSALEMNPVSVQIHSSNCNESSASTSMSKVHSEVVTVNQFAISPIHSTVRQKQRRSRSSSSESSSEDSSDSSTYRERKHRKKKSRKPAKKKSRDTRKSGERAHIVAAPRYGSQIVAKFKRENICQDQQLDT